MTQIPASPACPNIRILVRVRPPTSHELQHEQAVEITGSNHIRVLKENEEVGSSSVFESDYDHVIQQSATQAGVFDLVRDPITEALDGYNTTICAYGPTGTGKTYTMMGQPGTVGSEEPNEQGGIIPRAIRHIFDKIREREKPSTVYCSYIEIYSDKLQDLLQPYKSDYTKDPLDMVQKKAGLEIREDGKGALFVPDLMSVRVTNAHTVEKLIEGGNKNRAVRHTELNQHSSRSHTILQLVIERRGSAQDCQDESADFVRSKVNFVDLAGSERWNVNHDLTDQRISEMNFINSSLSSLSGVVSALTEGSQHIPYRCSKLTHLLQDSLGGNCKTALIFTVSPSRQSFEETCSTLKFADRARSILNNPVVNVQEDLAWVLEKKDKEIRRLRELVAALGEGREGVDEVLFAEFKARPQPTSNEEIQRLKSEVETLRKSLKKERNARAKLEEKLIRKGTGRHSSSQSKDETSSRSDIPPLPNNNATLSSSTAEMVRSPKKLAKGSATTSASSSSKIAHQVASNEERPCSNQGSSKKESSRPSSRIRRAWEEPSAKTMESLLGTYLKSKRDFSMYAPSPSKQRSRTGSRSGEKGSSSNGTSEARVESESTQGLISKGEAVTIFREESGSEMFQRESDGGAMDDFVPKFSVEAYSDAIRQEILDEENKFYARISDPGTSELSDAFSSLRLEDSTKFSSRQTSAWGRSSIMQPTEPSSPPYLDRVGQHFSFPHGSESLNFQTSAKSPASAATLAARISESFNSGLPSLAPQATFSDSGERDIVGAFSALTNTENLPNWGRSSLMDSRDWETSSSQGGSESRWQEADSRTLRASKSTTNQGLAEKRRRSKMRKRLSGSLDAGSLIYVLGNSSSSLKAKKIAEILKEN